MSVSCKLGLWQGKRMSGTSSRYLKKQDAPRGMWSDQMKAAHEKKNQRAADRRLHARNTSMKPMPFIHFKSFMNSHARGARILYKIYNLTEQATFSRMRQSPQRTEKFKTIVRFLDFIVLPTDIVLQGELEDVLTTAIRVLLDVQCVKSWQKDIIEHLASQLCLLLEQNTAKYVLETLKKEL